MIQQSLSYLLNQFSNKIYVVKTVDELLFNGYDDKLITMGKMSGLDEDSPPFDKFGWFYTVCQTIIFLALYQFKFFFWCIIKLFSHFGIITTRCCNRSRNRQCIFISKAIYVSILI